MFLLNSLVYIILWLYIHSPINLINEFIDGLLITPDPDTYLTPPQMIRRHGYPVETYNIPTPDGFILELHRIPHGIKEGEAQGNQFPILLIHGFFSSSFAWIANQPERSLAYLLADQGYDVWMINIRGNTYSQGHVKYTPMEREFWDFSFHEMGVYDLPTSVDFILNKTNHEQLFCIGDSAGNLEFFIMLSMLPAYNDKIIGQASLALLYHKPNPRTTEPTNSTAYTPNPLEYLYWNTPGSFLRRDVLTNSVIQILTTVELSPGYNLFDFLLLKIYGLRPDHINREIMPSVYSKFPTGTSIKAVLQLGQFVKDSFSLFDYGPEENLKIYGATFPPEYNISNIRIPVRIYHAKHDGAATPEDVQYLYDKLPVKAGVIEISDPNFCHIDFVYNQNTNELLNSDVLAFVNNITKKARAIAETLN